MVDWGELFNKEHISVYYKRIRTMKRITVLTIVLLMGLQSSQRVQAAAPLEYLTVGVNIASLAVFVWGVCTVRKIVADMFDIVSLNSTVLHKEYDIDNQIKSQSSYLMYLKSIKARIEAAYLLKHTPDDVLEVADFSEQERMWAAKLQLLDFEMDFEDDELSWDEFEKDTDVVDTTGELTEDNGGGVTFVTRS